MSLLFNQIMIADEKKGMAPMDILGQSIKAGSPGKEGVSKMATLSEYHSKISSPLGFSQLWHIILGAGVLIAAIICLTHLIRMFVVNYPKTVVQTKQKIAHALFVVALLSVLAFVFDSVLDVAQTAIGMN